MIFFESAAAWLRELASLPVLKAFCATVATFLMEAVGYPDSAFVFLFYLMIADYVLGFAQAWKTDTIRRNKLVQGAYKFMFMWLSVALLVLVDKALGKSINALDSMWFELHDLYIAYLCIGEFFSCTGHLVVLGLKPFPDSFLKRLEQYRARIDSGDFNDKDGKE